MPYNIWLLHKCPIHFTSGILRITLLGQCTLLGLSNQHNNPVLPPGVQIYQESSENRDTKYST